MRVSHLPPHVTPASITAHFVRWALLHVACNKLLCRSCLHIRFLEKVLCSDMTCLTVASPEHEACFTRDSSQLISSEVLSSISTTCQKTVCKSTLTLHDDDWPNCAKANAWHVCCLVCTCCMSVGDLHVAFTCGSSPGACMLPCQVWTSEECDCGER